MRLRKITIDRVARIQMAIRTGMMLEIRPHELVIAATGKDRKILKRVLSYLRSFSLPTDRLFRILIEP